jgi:hypothetical protein
MDLVEKLISPETLALLLAVAAAAKGVLVAVLALIGSATVLVAALKQLSEKAQSWAAKTENRTDDEWTASFAVCVGACGAALDVARKALEPIAGNNWGRK